MGLSDFFKKIIIHTKAKQVTSGLLDENMDMKSAEEKIIQLLKKYPEMRKSILSEVGRQIDESEHPNTLLDRVVVNITQNDEIPNSVIKAKSVIENMTDEGKAKLVRENDIGLQTQAEVASLIEREELKQKTTNIVEKRISVEKNIRDKNILLEIYRNIGKKNPVSKYLKDPKILFSDPKIVDYIISMDINRENEDVNIIIQNIVAKLMAYDYFRYGSIKLLTFSSLIPVEEMYSCNLPEIIEKEWIKLVDKQNTEKVQHKYKYDSSKINRQLLEYITKQNVQKDTKKRLQDVIKQLTNKPDTLIVYEEMQNTGLDVLLANLDEKKRMNMIDTMLKYLQQSQQGQQGQQGNTDGRSPKNTNSSADSQDQEGPEIN